MYVFFKYVIFEKGLYEVVISNIFILNMKYVKFRKVYLSLCIFNFYLLSDIQYCQYFIRYSIPTILKVYQRSENFSNNLFKCDFKNTLKWNCTHLYR